MKIFRTVTICATPLLAMLPLVGFAADVLPEGRVPAQVAQRKDTGWVFYANDRQGYALKLPGELQLYLKKRRNMQQAAEERLPFDYVNFRPKEGSGRYEAFELGVGVHWNRDNLGTKEFAGKKDEGLIANGAQIVMIRQSEVFVAGIKGVRDDFRMLQPDGWKSYARVIVPH